MAQRLIGSALVSSANSNEKIRIFATNENWDTQSNVPQYPVQAGMPITDMSAVTAKTLTIEGYLFSDSVFDDRSAQLEINILGKWQRVGQPLVWWGRKGSNNLVIQEFSATYDEIINLIKVTVTLTLVNFAGNTQRILKVTNKGNQKPVNGGKPVTAGVWLTVKRNDTYWGWSRRYGTSIAQLRTWNKWPDRRIPIGGRARVK